MGLLNSYDTAIRGLEYVLKSTTIQKSDTFERLLEIRGALTEMSGARAAALVARIDAILRNLEPIVETSHFEEEDTINICLKTCGIAGILILFATYIHSVSHTPLA